MKNKMRILAGFVMAAMLLAGCGAGNQTTQKSASAASTENTSTEQQSTADASTEDISDTQKAADASTDNTSSGETNENADGSASLPNPFVDYDTLEEAEKAAGFSFDVPDTVTVNGVISASRMVQVMSGSMIQVIYLDKDGNQLCMLRKEAADKYPSGDITGDYNAPYYEYTDSIKVGEVTATVRGKSEDKICDAIWTVDGYNMSVFSSDGMTHDEMKTLVNDLLKNID